MVQKTVRVNDTANRRHVKCERGPVDNGPSTSVDRAVVSDRSEPIAIYCERSVTNECSHLSAVPQMPKTITYEKHFVIREKLASRTSERKKLINDILNLKYIATDGRKL